MPVLFGEVIQMIGFALKLKVLSARFAKPVPPLPWRVLLVSLLPAAMFVGGAVVEIMVALTRRTLGAQNRR